MSRLTDEQHVELLLVFGDMAATEGKAIKQTILIARWSEVFDWVKQRWPELLSCASYVECYDGWKEGGSPMAHDMSVLIEIHNKLRIRK